MSALSRRAVLAAGVAAPVAFGGRGAEAQSPSTLSIGVVSDPVTLDPAFSGSFFEAQVFYNLHEPLLIAQPDGRIIPGLTQDYTMRDPLTYAFTLRPGLTFHDGTKLDAAAVKFNLDRYLDPAVGSIRRADFGPTKAVVVTGELSFEIQLSAPYAPLPLVLTNRAGMIVSPTALKLLGPDFAAKAVGAGPWKLSHWTKNSELVLEKFPGYWQGPTQPFDRLLFRPLPDETVRLANLRSGTLQLIDGVPPQSVATLGHDQALRVSQMAGLGFNAFSLNCARAPFNDVRVRTAFVAAVDVDVIQRIVYFGTGAASHGPLSPSVPWAFDQAYKGIAHDPEHAKALLKAAGVSTPLPIAITVTNSPQMVRIAQIIQAQAGEAGFQVTIQQIDATSLLSVLQKHDFEICMSPWSGRYDPDGNMFFWFTKDGPNNFSDWKDDTITDLLQRARSATDRAARVQLYHQAQDYAGEQAPMLFLHFDAIIQASTANLRWTQYPDAVFRLFDARMT
jgi:peptide/nickel transport system substrate-binding protein